MKNNVPASMIVEKTNHRRFNQKDYKLESDYKPPRHKRIKNKEIKQRKQEILFDELENDWEVNE